MFKNFTLCLGALLCVISADAQFKGLVYEEIDNKGLVPGKTYRIYAQMEAEGDVVDAIFGDGDDYLEVKSTAPFFSMSGAPMQPMSSSAQTCSPLKGCPMTAGSPSAMRTTT